MAKKKIQRKNFIITETSSGGQVNSILAESKEEALEIYLDNEGYSIDVEKCPDCDAELRFAMIDVDGTNLEEGMECTERCGYERVGIE